MNKKVGASQGYGELFFPKFLVLFSIFICTGIALSFSLSYSFSIQQGQQIGGLVLEHAGFIKIFLKQCLIIGIGAIGIYVVLRTRTQIMRNASFFLCCVGILLMIFTALWGVTINGARRWLYIGGISLQTGDFARVTLLLYICHIFDQFHSKLVRGGMESPEKILKIKTKLIVRFCAVVSLYIGSLYIQKDYSSFLLSGVIILAITMCSDLSLNLKILALVGLTTFFIFVILSNPNRMERIVSFLHPSKDAFNTGFQLSQSYALIKEGGLFGKGIGGAMLDVLSLPYFYNDFVFSVIIAEFGLFGASFVLLLFLLFWSYSYNMCKVLYSQSRFYFYVVLACTSYILTSVMGHIAVTVGLVPTAGLNMPFYSMGGSFMINLLLMCALILKASLIADRRYIQTKTFSHSHTSEKRVMPRRVSNFAQYSAHFMVILGNTSR